MAPSLFGQAEECLPVLLGDRSFASADAQFGRVAREKFEVRLRSKIRLKQWHQTDQSHKLIQQSSGGLGPTQLRELPSRDEAYVEDSKRLATVRARI
jgi:hypothetical protein